MIHLARETQKLHNLGLFVIIDSKVQDYSMLVEGVERDATVLILDPLRDGLEQITQLIQRFKFQIKNIQIICHGAPGLLFLGNTILSLENIEEYSSHLQQWNVDEILLYSCNVAAPIPHKKVDHLFPISHRFLNRLHQLTTANIAASSTPIGNSKKGGNWELDIQIGKITSPVIFKPEILAAYPSILAITFTNILAELTGVQRSSLAWGDYDNDNDLDILLTGFDGNNRISQVYRNDVGTFNNINAELMGVSSSAAAWGDYDNDGDLDIILSGDDNNLNPVSKIYRNDGGNFIDINAALTNIRASAVAWGDYDNDGDLDIVLSGSDGSQPITQVYRNQNGTFVESGAELVGVSTGSVAWGDYDNDGDLDILLTGLGQSLLPFSRVYRNDNGNFTDINAGLRDVWFGSAVWGDYDNDGQLDIFLTGRDNGGTPVIKIYRNQGSSFTDINGNVTNGEGSSGVWGDYDNDGDLDILLASDSGSFNPISRIYRNDAGNFVEINPEVTDVRDSSVAWGDYDNDGDLDILVAGIDGSSNRVTQVYRNDGTPPNTPPSLVPNLNANVFKNSVDFSWQSASDAETPSASLTYNLRVGTTPGGLQVFAPQSQTPTSGNVGSNTRWTLGNLEPGTYYWSVQAVDSAFAESPFAPEGTFEILPATYNFSLPNFTTPEGNTPNLSNLVEIIRTGDVNTTEEVTVTVIGGTADTTDYTNTPFSVNFNPGETSKFVEIELLGDLSFEPDETLELQLSSFSGLGGAGLQDTTALVLQNDDNPATYNFSSPNFTTPEGNTANLFNLVEIIRTGDVNTTEEVTVTVIGGTADTADYTNTPFSVNFNPGETSKFVAIELLGDLSFEPDETLELQLSSFSGLGGAGLQDTTALVLQNDDNPATYNFSSPNFTTPEGNTANLFNLVEIIRTGDVNTTEEVTVTVIGGTADTADYTNTPFSVNFNPGETSKFVAIELLGDLSFEPDETLELQLSSFSGLGGAGLQDTTALVLQNDDNPATYNFSSPNFTTPEGNTANLFNLVEIIRTGDVNTTEEVTVTVIGGTADTADYTNTPFSVNFNPGETSKFVAIELLGDLSFEPDETLELQLSSFSGLGGAGLQDTTTLVLENDDSLPQIEFEQINYQVNEETPELEVTLKRIGNTSDTSTIEIQFSDETATGGVDFNNQTIIANFAPNQTTATVNIPIFEDDFIEETERFELTLINPSEATEIGTRNVANVEIFDNDIAGFNLTSTNLSVSEFGTTDSYSISLSTEPTSPVTVRFNTDNQLESISEILFNSTNWNIPQTLEVTASDDAIAEGLHQSAIIHLVTSEDPNYHNFEIADINVEITDNDTAGISITPVNLSVSESGETNSYNIVLTTAPIYPVTVQFETGNQLNSLPEITFDQSNWNVPQTVTVSAIDDSAIEEDQTAEILHNVLSQDENYQELELSSVVATITDNDVNAEVIINSNVIDAIEEGQTTSYEVVLNSPPTSPVTVDFNTSDRIQQIPEIIFNETNWNIPQTVTIVAIDDEIAEGDKTDTITHSVESLDPNFNELVPAEVLVEIKENDSAAVAITQTYNTTTVSENGVNDTYSVMIESQPIADVNVTLTPDHQIDLSQGEGEVIHLIFTPKNWNSPQIVTVEAVDDQQLEAEIHTSTIHHSIESEDFNYNSDSSITIDGVEATHLTVQITENDQPLPPGIPGIRLIQPIGSTNLLEGFSQDSYKIVLQSIPTAEVNITIVSDDKIQSNQQVITFTPDNWNIPQTITLTAIEDNIIEGETTSLVTHTVSSEDSRYQSLEIDKISVNIADYNTTEDATILSEPSVISLTDIDNEIIGSLGEDVIYGRDGNDRLFGQAGADFILGQAGSDGISGEEGDDILVGGQGNDHIYGNLGNDIMFGDTASDRLWGGGGNDQLFGGFGDDRLFGEAGRDTLTGGLGNDAFVVGVGGGGSTIEQADILADFTDTQDRIELIDSLTFDQLNILANLEGTAAIIQVQSSGEYLAVLPGVSVESLDAQDFV